MQADDKQIDIIDLKDGMKIVGFYLVKRAELRISNASKKEYLDATLADKTGEVNAKAWGIDEGILDIFELGGLVKIKAKVKMWNDKPQLNLEQFRTAVPDDGVGISDFVPTAPGNPDEYYDYIMMKISSFNNQNMSLLVKALILDKKEEFLIYPAAKSNHHAVRSGLLYHVYRMLKLAEAMKEVYPNIDLDILSAGIILHDLCKIDEMSISDVGLVTDYTIEGNMLGHITMGIVNLSNKAEKLGIKDEFVLLLKHMILSHHYLPEYGSPVQPMFLEAELLHHIDIIDARLYDFENIYKTVDKGSLSEPVWSLDRRRVYRPKDLSVEQESEIFD